MEVTEPELRPGLRDRRHRKRCTDGDAVRKTLWRDPVDATKNETVLCAGLDGRACEYPSAIILVQAFEPGGKIDGCAQRRIVHAFRRADVPDDGVANVKAEPRLVERP